MPPEETTTTAPRDEQFTQNIAGAVARLIAKNGGDSSEAINLVLAENQRYRDRHRHDTALIQQFKDAAPKEGTRILTKEEATAYAAFEALKLKPEDIAKLQAENSELKAKTEQHERAKTIGAAAEAVGYQGELLTELLTARGMHVEMKEVTIPDPKDSKKTLKQLVPHVRKASDATAQLEPLTEYAERDLKLYGPALRKDAGKDESRGGRSTRGVEFPTQAASTRTGKAGEETGGKDVVDRHIAGTYPDPFATPSSPSK